MKRILGGGAHDGWSTYKIEGWEGLTVAVRVATIDGRNRVTALKIEPHDPSAPERVTIERLRTLPLQTLADDARMATDYSLQPDPSAAHRALASTPTAKRGPRAQVTVEEVAEKWNAAFATGRPQRTAVCEELFISPRTADRYIARAREAGLITHEAHPSRTHQGTNTQERNP